MVLEGTVFFEDLLDTLFFEDLAKGLLVGIGITLIAMKWRGGESISRDTSGTLEPYVRGSFLVIVK